MLERALGLVPELPASELAQDVRCLVPLAQARLACHDGEGALEAIDRAMKNDLEALDPMLVAEMGLQRGRILLALGRDEEARKGLLDTFQALRELTGAESPALREVLLALLCVEDRTRGASVGLVDLVEMIEDPLQRTTPATLARAARAAWERGETSFQGPLVQVLMRLAEKKPERLPETFAALERVRARSELATLAWRVESAEALEHPILGQHLAHFPSRPRRRWTVERPLRNPSSRAAARASTRCAERARRAGRSAHATGERRPRGDPVPLTTRMLGVRRGEGREAGRARAPCDCASLAPKLAPPSKRSGTRRALRSRAARGQLCTRSSR
jgi:hypothetical protein